MPLAPGTRLGPYEILTALGAGGMGEVYRARDTRLHRDVAVKVLPPTFANDPDRRTRFEREAQAVAALSHANILAVFDTGHHDGQLYVVMELLAGETLHERLRAGPLPVRKAVEIGIQIARGLAAAHDKGIVHRDLKPENVFLLSDGQVKILDFGLARAVGTGSGVTETVPVVTDPGMVMGTVGYMAPEQIRGQAVDPRADLFALGVVLYELLSGRAAFRRESAADTMAAILNEDPPELSSQRPGVSPALNHIVRHCLEKNRHERFQSARDVAFALASLSGPESTSRPAHASQRRPARLGAGLALGVVCAAALGGLWVGRQTARPADVTYDVKTWDRETIYNARFLPDGAIVYSSARQGTTPELFVLHANRLAPERLAGPGTHLLSVSPSGELAVLVNATYIEARLFQGTLARLTPGDSPRPWLDKIREADWSPNGSTMAVVHALETDRDRLEYPVGTALYEVPGYISDLRVSHDGARVAFVEHAFRFDDRGVVKVTDQSGHITTLTEAYPAVEGLAWSADDHDVVFSASELGGTTPGLQVFVVSSTGGRTAHIALPTAVEAWIFDVDQHGRWLVAGQQRRWGIMIKRPGDMAEQELSWLNLSTSAQLSKDGSQMLFSSQSVGEGPDYAVMLRKTDGSPPERLGDGWLMGQGWSPDGRWVASFLVSASQFVFYPTGAGAAQRFTTSPNVEFGGWFPDSQNVLLEESINGRAPRCYRQPIAGGPPSPVGPDDADTCFILPDGGLLVHTRSGKSLLFDRPDGPPTNVMDFDQDPVAFDSGGFVFTGTHSPNQALRLERVNLRTGTRTLVADVAMVDRAGLVKLRPTSVVGSAGRYGYAYTYARTLSTLMLVSGARLH